MAYKIINGILHHNGKPEFALGQSYYPSFHHAKYPVPPEGDRVGEMQKDFALMKDMGFNFIRIAAIGNTYLKDEKVVVDTPFADQMMAEGAKDDIAMSVRLQGYVFNLHDNKDYRMINHLGQEQDPTVWYNFIQSCLNHEGTSLDNRIGTIAVAEHFKDAPSLVSFQIYNEPHYPDPKTGIYDYHPKAIEAYRKWLVDEGYKTLEQARDYTPPKTRTEQSPYAWALWRLFSQKNLAHFLNQSSNYAKEAAPNIPTYTCFTTEHICHGNAYYGTDYFKCAEIMDISGFTCYYAPCGNKFFRMLSVFNIAESSAALFGKTSWCIELSSINGIPSHHFNRQSYAAVGAGLKGIVYYQWRGDYPSEATPIPNGCGFVNYDGTKMPNYDNAQAIVKFLRSMSDLIINAQKVRYGIGILCSDYANFLCDAIENGDSVTIDETENLNTYQSNLHMMFKTLICRGYSVDFLNAEHLESNTLGIKYLFVPQFKFLSPKEVCQVECFQDNGGIVYEMYNMYGDVQQHRCVWPKFHVALDMQDIIDTLDTKPLFCSTNRCLIPQTLKGDDYYLVCLTNTTEPARDIADECLLTSAEVKQAVFYESGKAPIKCQVSNGKIHLPKVIDGGFVVAR